LLLWCFIGKLAWLITVVVYWYVLPVYWLMDCASNQKVQLACGLFLIFMLLRAVVELGMMYISKNWLHIYGIGHSMFTAALCFILAWCVFRTHRLTGLYFFYCTCLFVLESWFATYLKSVSDGDGSVFFIDSSPEHNVMLRITSIAVIISVAMLGYLTRNKARATT